ncbi:protein adenylyltransferase SelO, mitochondrial-like [Dendronephthya gigantea]|uniref:protein adenylyltransferase SelO, mitochondrial-like n=1 Tax=Dendronephthya gigantea TaxID=151771 RepID=UPI00106BF3E3|nr:protein adenylyltransferase SelO, mitochondrial-like [Dendronephthya gigantea]
MLTLLRGSARHFKPQKLTNIIQDLSFGRNTSATVSFVQFVGRYQSEFISEKRNMTTLETLNFDNLALRSLPIDPVKENFVRQVPNACFSLVEPTAVKDPELVVHSESAMNLLGLNQEQAKRKEFPEYFSGNKKLPGSQTAAHCYCGHQFGSFAGQLGDGAAIYLGEVINSNSERWEIQLKGAGKTPFSRSADGRKVLRSSIREFLCSEAMHHLGIPTTRAGCCITSDTKVVRDIFYDGNPIYEKSSIVLRIAPTFIRFGSFEIVKNLDLMTGRRGPSAGKKDILIQLLEYVIKTFYPQVHEEHGDNSEDRYLAFYKEVISRTARLVADWQCVGFCHGVLNTDNMSILGLTIDYGPFGFMDHFNPDFVCNASDDTARYSYKAQPEICKWNLIKLAEALADVLPLAKSRALLEEIYDLEYMNHYLSKMRKKLGIIHKALPSDRTLVEELLRTMEETGADFTNVFRCLSRIKVQDSPDFEKNNGEVLEYILSQCLDPSDLPREQAVSGQLQMLLLMMSSNPALAAQLEQNPWVRTEKEKMERAKKLREVPPDEKRLKDRESWISWIKKYRKRIEADFEQETQEKHLIHNARVDIMNTNNPRFVLRNYIAENAIKAAENGDYSLVQYVLSVLESPYSDDVERKVEIPSSSTKAEVRSGEHGSNHTEFIFDHKSPRWAHQLRVT